MHIKFNVYACIQEVLTDVPYFRLDYKEQSNIFKQVISLDSSYKLKKLHY